MFRVNPIRLPKRKYNLFSWTKFFLWYIAVKPIASLGFFHKDFYYIHGSTSKNKLYLGINTSTNNACFNISSGNIIVGDNTIFGHDVMVVTGQHRFHKGQLCRLSNKGISQLEVPKTGNDIRIGSGCFIGSRAVLIKNVVLGNNCLVAAGSIVTKSFPDNSVIAGVPARCVGTTLDHSI